jgi:hypothetical protein
MRLVFTPQSAIAVIFKPRGNCGPELLHNLNCSFHYMSYYTHSTVSPRTADSYSIGQDLLCRRKFLRCVHNSPGISQYYKSEISLGQLQLRSAHCRPCTTESESYNCGVSIMIFSVNVYGFSKLVLLVFFLYFEKNGSRFPILKK